MYAPKGNNCFTKICQVIDNPPSPPRGYDDEPEGSDVGSAEPEPDDDQTHPYHAVEGTERSNSDNRVMPDSVNNMGNHRVGGIVLVIFACSVLL